MVGMRVIEADDVFAAPAAFTLNADQLLRIDVVAVVGGIGARIAGTGDRGYGANAVFIHLAEQNATAFVGIGLLAVVPESFVVFASNIQHGTQFTTETQSHRENSWLIASTSHLSFRSAARARNLLFSQRRHKADSSSSLRSSSE